MVSLSLIHISISRAKDDVPNGHEMAYFPSKDGWAMMMVEDVFPWTGDLDMNDIVFNFRIEYEVNRKNQEDPGVWGMTVRIKPMAMGGNMYKQIGLALNFVGKDIALTNIKVDGQAFMDAKDKNDNSMFTLGKGLDVYKRQELGWEPSLQFEEGIEKTVRWYLENQDWLDNVTSGEYMNYYKEMYHV